MRQHINIIGYLHIAQSLLVLLGAGIVLLVFGGIGALSMEPTAFSVMSILGIIFSFLVAIWAVPGLIAAYGLLKRRPWGRVLGLIMGAFDLLNFPLGTALGVYTFWALLSDEAHRAFSSRSRTRSRSASSSRF